MELLLEIFGEEMPARMQPRACDDLRRLVTDGLAAAGVGFEAAAAFATPRRLALSVTGLPRATEPRLVAEKGPKVDAPAAALAGFLRKHGATEAELIARDDKKGAFYELRRTVPGRALAEVVAEVVPGVIRGFPWPKSMRWGDGALRWVRPIQSILAQIGDEAGYEAVVFDLDGIPVGDSTEGHRFMAKGRFAVRGFEDYVARLDAARVILDGAERASRLWHEASQLAFAQGLELVEDPALLTEVAGLVEWPVVLAGPIEPRFLGLPPEVLQTSMRTHQKFFALRRPQTGRIEGFVTVANIETPDHGALILAGNRRVLAARLSDAVFFWESDLAQVQGRGEAGLAAMAEPLDRATFHNKLGTQAQRVARIAELARRLAPLVGADPALAAQAARVAKADLPSAMVGEFPELQGIMGRYYAEAAGLDRAVAAACAEHYAPLGPGDQVARAPVSVTVALADKLDTLSGFWAIDEKPTGTRDPFALRRAALGVIRLVLENDLALDLRAVLAGPWVEDLLGFIADRLKVYLRDQGLRHDVIAACWGLGGEGDLRRLVARARALQGFLGTEAGANLLAGYRRAANILAAEERADGVEYSGTPDRRFAEDPAEHALFDALAAAAPRISAALAAEDFAAAMAELAQLRGPIDGFFEAVQVNAPVQVVRRNRLCLLGAIRTHMAPVAVWAQIEG